MRTSTKYFIAAIVCLSLGFAITLSDLVCYLITGDGLLWYIVSENSNV